VWGSIVCYLHCDKKICLVRNINKPDSDGDGDGWKL
jgi:hypothetical protein